MFIFREALWTRKDGLNKFIIGYEMLVCVKGQSYKTLHTCMSARSSHAVSKVTTSTRAMFPSSGSWMHFFSEHTKVRAPVGVAIMRRLRIIYRAAGLGPRQLGKLCNAIFDALIWVYISGSTLAVLAPTLNLYTVVWQYNASTPIGFLRSW